MWNLVQDKKRYLAMLHISCLSKLCAKQLSSFTACSHGDNSISLPRIDNVNNTHIKQLHATLCSKNCCTTRMWLSVLDCVSILFNETLNILLIYYLSQCALLELYEIENGLCMRRNMSLVYTHKIYCLNIVVFSLIHV